MYFVIIIYNYINDLSTNKVKTYTEGNNYIRLIYNAATVLIIFSYTGVTLTGGNTGVNLFGSLPDGVSINSNIEVYTLIPIRDANWTPLADTFSLCYLNAAKKFNGRCAQNHTGVVLYGTYIVPRTFFNIVE